jgi:hypothetical protein
MSIQDTRKAAFVGSFALVAHHMANIAPEICEPDTLSRWEAYRQYSENLEEFLRNPILKIDITEPASVFQFAQLKLQHRLSIADHTRRSRDLIERMRLPLPGVGAACSFGATDDLKVTKLQVMANLEKHTSGWLHVDV